LNKIIKDEAEITTAEKSDRITFPCEFQVRPHDRVYVITLVS